MKQAAIYAGLIVLVLSVPDFAQISTDKRDSLNPLMYYFSLDNQASQEALGSISSINSRHIAYMGVTAKPLSFAWFHVGAKSTLAQSSEMSTLYREPVAILTTIGLKVVQDIFHVSAGFRMPLSTSALPVADTTGFDNMYNGLSPYPNSNILPLQAMLLGAYLQHRAGPMYLRYSFTYNKPNTEAYELYTGYRNYHTTFMGYLLSAQWRSSGALHTMDLKLNTFGNEKLNSKETHTEGALTQARYGFRFHSGSNANEYALGVAYKAKDYNREDSLSNPTKEADNSNVQRVYSEVIFLKPHWGNSLMQIGLMPQLLYNQNGGKIGFQGNLTGYLKLKPKDFNYLKISCEIYYGMIDTETITGGGVKFHYTIHRARSNAPDLYPQR